MKIDNLLFCLLILLRCQNIFSATTLYCSSSIFEPLVKEAYKAYGVASNTNFHNTVQYVKNLTERDFGGRWGVYATGSTYRDAYYYVPVYEGNHFYWCEFNASEKIYSFAIFKTDNIVLPQIEVLTKMYQHQLGCLMPDLKSIINGVATKFKLDPALHVIEIQKQLNETFGGSWGVFVSMEPRLIGSILHFSFPNHLHEVTSKQYPAFCWHLENNWLYNVFKIINPHPHHDQAIQTKIKHNGIKTALKDVVRYWFDTFDIDLNSEGFEHQYAEIRTSPLQLKAIKKFLDAKNEDEEFLSIEEFNQAMQYIFSMDSTYTNLVRYALVLFISSAIALFSFGLCYLFMKFNFMWKLFFWLTSFLIWSISWICLRYFEKWELQCQKEKAGLIYRNAEGTTKGWTGGLREDWYLDQHIDPCGKIDSTDVLSEVFGKYVQMFIKGLIFQNLEELAATVYQMFENLAGGKAYSWFNPIGLFISKLGGHIYATYFILIISIVFALYFVLKSGIVIELRLIGLKIRGNQAVLTAKEEEIVEKDKKIQKLQQELDATKALLNDTKIELAQEKSEKESFKKLVENKQMDLRNRLSTIKRRSEYPIEDPTN